MDEEICDRGISISDRGMVFSSRWRFDIGAQLSVVCNYHHPEGGRKRVVLEGTVVWCEPLPVSGGCAPRMAFQTTILFLELPDELKDSLREFSYQLAAAG